MVEHLKVTERHESMRGWFVFALHAQMAMNGDIWVVTGDLGFGMFDRIRNDFPDRFVNVGAAEQAMMGVGVGLAVEGKKPIVYSMTPFLLYRPLETIRNYLYRDAIPVKIVGGGRGQDYIHHGFSHWAEEDRQVMALFPNIESYWPETKGEIPEVLDLILASSQPCYLNLRK